MKFLTALSTFIASHRTKIYIFLFLWLLIGCLIAGYLFRSSYELQLPYKKIQFPKTSMGVNKVYAAESTIIPSEVDVFDTDQVKQYVHQESNKIFGESEWKSLELLLIGESNFRTYAFNFVAGGDEGACGIFQALPCSKLGVLGLDLENQTHWGLQNIKNGYGTPSNAYNKWLARNPHYY